MSSEEIYIKVTENGPYLVYGVPQIGQKIIIADENGFCLDYADGQVFEVKTSPTVLCRCGKSKNAPFCDTSHDYSEFDGTETASFKPILDAAQKFEGPNLVLQDNENYCAIARFCDAHGSIWVLVQKGEEDADAESIRQAGLCPSGRLIMFDKGGNMIEEFLPKSIVVLEDDGLKLSGPIWVRGGIRVESVEGKSYEIRNRQTLCRCGKSGNKPFCNGAHCDVNFKAQYKKD